MTYHYDVLDVRLSNDPYLAVGPALPDGFFNLTVNINNIVHSPHYI